MLGINVPSREISFIMHAEMMAMELNKTPNLIHKRNLAHLEKMQTFTKESFNDPITEQGNFCRRMAQQWDCLSI